jgi:hypothetical protein
MFGWLQFGPRRTPSQMNGEGKSGEYINLSTAVDFYARKTDDHSYLLSFG